MSETTKMDPAKRRVQTPVKLVNTVAGPRTISAIEVMKPTGAINRLVVTDEADVDATDDAVKRIEVRDGWIVLERHDGAVAHVNLSMINNYTLFYDA